MSGARRSGARGRWADFADDLTAPGSAESLTAVSPLSFPVVFDGTEHLVDLSDLPCPGLARAVVPALRAAAARRSSWSSYRGLLDPLRAFLAFVAAAEPEHAADLEPDDLEPDHVDAFEAALLRTHGEDSRVPHAQLVALVHVLREVHEEDPGSFSDELLGRVGFASHAQAVTTSQPLDAYPDAVFDAIAAAARADVEAARRRIAEGESLAERGTDPEAAGWEKPENVLWHIDRHGPLTEAFLLQSEARRIRVRRAGGIRALNAGLYLRPTDILPFLVLLICETGLEPECARTLTSTCLTGQARGFVSLNYRKRRSGRSVGKSMRVRDGGALRHPGGLVRLALRLTRRGREQTGSEALWVGQAQGRVIDIFARGGRALWHHTAPWMRRHGLDRLTDHDGQPVRLDLRRLRKTVKSRQYLRASGVLVDFAQGHSREVAAGRYAAIGAHREVHERAVEDGLQQALAAAIPPPVVLDEDGNRLEEADASPTPAQIRAALSRESDVFIAACTDFHDTPHATPGKPCPVPVWGCLECPNAVFTTRHLPQILSFLDFTERQRDELAVPEWQLRYGTAWQRIVHGIRNKFRREEIATAQAIAEAGESTLLLPTEFWEILA
ncbi:hypothetical protein ACWDBD_32485 [Streptomyces sp. NPDC001118]